MGAPNDLLCGRNDLMRGAKDPTQRGAKDLTRGNDLMRGASDLMCVASEGQAVRWP